MNKFKFIFFLALLGILSCTKETNINEQIKSSTKNTENNSGFRNNSNTLSSMVSYNPQHDVLVFNSMQDVYNLQAYLSNQNPYDRGNSTRINQELNQVLNNGFGSGNQGNGNRVSLPNLQVLLENSHPLSETSLLKLIHVHGQVNFPISFIKNLLLANVPFSYDVEQAVSSVQNLPNSERATILDADDNLLDRMDYVYVDFLNSFPAYNSLYENMMNKNIQDLNSGMKVTSAQFDQCIIKSDFERLIRNDKLEIYIGDQLFKAYTECKEVKFKEAISGAYNELQKLDPNGNPVIPTINETPQGIAKNTIDQVIPPTYEVYNPQEFDPIDDATTDPNYNTALQTINMVETCPTSNFVPQRYTTINPNLIVFQNTTDFSNVYNPSSVYQYWDFGDGTGSFEASPTHAFPSYGTYVVILTSFSIDCGCWHRHKTEIVISGGARPPGGNPICKIYPSIMKIITPLSFNVNVNPDINPDNPDNEIIEYHYHIFKGENGAPATTYVETIISIFNNIDYTAAGIGKYRVRVDAIWADGCLSDDFTDNITLLEDPQSSTANCCDKKDKNKEKELPFTIGSNYYEFKFKDIIRGRVLKRVGGQQVLFKQNGSGKMRRVKANHNVIVGSNVCPTLDGFNGDCTIAWNNYGDPTNTGEERSFEYGNYWPSADNFAFTGDCDFTHSCSYGGDLIVDAYVATLVCE